MEYITIDNLNSFFAIVGGIWITYYILKVLWFLFIKTTIDDALIGFKNTEILELKNRLNKLESKKKDK